MAVLKNEGDDAVVGGGGGDERHGGEVAVDGAGGKKKTAGRQKIPIEKIKDKNKLDVAFSKRRQGFFKKAAELSILCDKQIAVIAFSRGNNAYSFGSPSVDYVIDRFNDRIPSTKSTSNINSAKVAELLEQLNAANKLLAFQREGHESNVKGYWWNKEPIDRMSLKQLQEFHRCLAAFRNMAVGTWGLNL